MKIIYIRVSDDLHKTIKQLALDKDSSIQKLSEGYIERGIKSSYKSHKPIDNSKNKD